MAYTRMEEFTSADPAPQSVVRVKIGATRDGTLTTLEGEMIFDAARDIDAPGPDNNTGYGLVDAGAAYALLSHPIDDDHDGYSISTDCNDHDAELIPGEQTGDGPGEAVGEPDREPARCKVRWRLYVSSLT